jgi:hypothetical protein
VSRPYCRECGRPVLTLSGVPLSDGCPYCGASLSGGAEDGDPPERGDGRQADRGPEEERLRRENTILCWFCGYLNSASDRFCAECDADLFAVRGEVKEADVEKRFVYTLSHSERDIYLIEGIKALIQAILKREGNEDGIITCHNRGCKGGSYKYDEFRCPKCGGPTLLQEMRAAVEGRLDNGTILKELQGAFPQYGITKYTNAAVMDHRSIAACKLDLEDASRTVSAVLETGAEFLRAVTASGGGSGSRSGGGEGGGDGGQGVRVEEFSPARAGAPDDTVLQLLNIEGISGRGGGNPAGPDHPEPIPPTPPEEGGGEDEDRGEGGDWTSP